MIKLIRPAKPVELTPEKGEELKAIYNATGEPVWKTSFIKKPLMEMSFDKCAYSELKLDTESTYTEIEHFRHKDQYPEDVVNWENLLPACKKCNATKGSWDVMSTPIVNPTIDDPKLHLYIKGYRFYGITEKGKNTIEAVALNDDEHFVKNRFIVGNDIIQALNSEFDSLIESTTDRQKKTRINRIKNILYRGLPDKQYAASNATAIVFENGRYQELLDYLESNGLWDEDLESITSTIQNIALIPPQ